MPPFRAVRVPENALFNQADDGRPVGANDKVGSHAAAVRSGLGTMASDRP